jgi:hypothetical protein
MGEHEDAAAARAASMCSRPTISPCSNISSSPMAWIQMVSMIIRE